MVSLIKFVFSILFIVHGFYLFKGYQDNNSVLTKVKCSSLNTYTDIEKTLFLNKSHQIGCSLNE